MNKTRVAAIAAAVLVVPALLLFDIGEEDAAETEIVREMPTPAAEKPAEVLAGIYEDEVPAASEKPPSAPSGIAEGAPSSDLPLEIRSRLLQAREALYDGDGRQAVEMLEDLLASYPDNQHVLSELAVALDETGQGVKAVEHLEHALFVNPSNKTALEEASGIYARAYREKEGLKLFRKLYEADPEDPRVMMGLGKMLAANRDYAEAIKLVEAAGNALPADSLLAAAEIYRASGQQDKVAALFEAAAKDERVMSPEDRITIRSNYIQNLIQNRNLDAARRELASLAEDSPEYEMLGWLEQELEKQN